MKDALQQAWDAAPALAQRWADGEAKAKAELEAMRKDAERYRWLRSRPDWLGWDHDFRSDEVEREIDAAMQAERGSAAA